MKKRLFTIFLMLCLLVSGCAKAQAPSEPEANTNTEQTDSSSTLEESQTTELSSEALLEEYLKNLDILDTPVREYGEDTGYILLEEDLVARILYPEGEITALNDEIVSWVEAVVAEYTAESVGSSADGDAAELTAEYDSYIAEGDIVSIKITGLYDKPYLAHPIDIIATFHASIKTGQLLSLDDILLPGGREQLQNTVIEQAGIEKELVDEYLLDHWTLTSEGLEIILERGDYLAMSDGTVTLQYSYEELEGILALPGETVTEESVAEEAAETDSGETALEALPATAIDPSKPMVALTFDDGPSKHTERLLDTFAAHGGKGTFFVVGNILDKRTEALQRMAKEGHEIAGHSWNHRQLTKLGTEELTDQIMTTRAKIYEITGVDSTLIRPPYGSYNDHVKSVCANLGIVMANWSLDTLDWKYKDANRIHQTIMREVKDGDIILCHDLHGTTVDAMEIVIPDLIAQGYQLVTVSELLSYSDKDITAGGVYNNR